MNKRKNTSFTLIELLVVIVIIGVLAAVIVVTTTSSIGKANVAKLKVFEESVANNLAANMVSRWRLDEKNGSGPYTTPDAWGNNTGTLYGSTGTQVLPQLKDFAACVYDACFEFDGYDDAIGFANSNSLDIKGKEITISGWFNIHGLGAGGQGGAIIEKYTRYGIHIQNSGSGTLYANYLISTENNAWANNWGSIIDTNKWYHIAMTYNGNLSSNQLKGYLNGNIDGQWSKTGNILSNSVMVLVGQWNAVIPTGYFDGLMDDVRIYDAALSASQIKQDYIAGINSLLSKGLISKGEYNQRIEELSSK